MPSPSKRKKAGFDSPAPFIFYKGIFSGCMVKLDGTVVSMSNVVAVERDGKIVYVPNAPYRIDLNTKGNK